ncbi:MAG TPA: Crp/Fnr family transcriptional regulator [Candidatus Saccharimonadales bacterium]
MEIKEKVAAFFGHYPAQTYAKRELLLRAEEPVRSVFYIVEGRVSQYDITPNGSEVVVNVFKPGAFFPMSSAINDVENYYFFEASVETKVRIAPKADAVRFLQDNPDVVFDLLARVYRGVDGVLRRMAHLMGGSAKSRLIFELMNATYRFGEPRPDGSTLITLTESELARHSGLARETVNRTLQDLKAGCFVQITASGITIPDVRKLEESLGNDV